MPVSAQIHRCKLCQGKGKVPAKREFLANAASRIVEWMDCPKCQGTGKFEVKRARDGDPTPSPQPAR